MQIPRSEDKTGRHKKTRIQLVAKAGCLFSSIFLRARKLNIKSAQVDTLIKSVGNVNVY